MAKYTVKLIKREEIADDTMAFHFEKPSMASLAEGGPQGFEFKAGQFIEVTLLNPPEPGSENATAPTYVGANSPGSRISTIWETDAEGNTRAFSIAAAPSEPDLMIVTRMRDTAFKRVLKTAPLGTEVQIEGPFGDFVLHNNASRPAIFLIGGIGITPVRSIVIEAAAKQLSHKIFLFYSNRQPKDAAFFNELKDLELKNPNYKFIPTMTDVMADDTSWSGERGYISMEMLKKYLGELVGGIYYSSGPQAMVAAMRKMLNAAGVDDDNIKTEEFSGY